MSKPIDEKLCTVDEAVGLIEDEKIVETLPSVEGKTTVIRLEKMHIKSIKFVEGL